jgi:hypothetical protein
MITASLTAELDEAQRMKLLTYEINPQRTTISIALYEDVASRARAVKVQQYIQSTYNYETHIVGYDIGLIVYDIAIKVTHL